MHYPIICGSIFVALSAPLFVNITLQKKRGIHRREKLYENLSFFLALCVVVILGCTKDGEIVTEKKDETVYASYCLVYVFNPNLMGTHQTEIRNLREGGFIMRYEVTEESIYHSLFEKPSDVIFKEKEDDFNDYIFLVDCYTKNDKYLGSISMTRGGLIKKNYEEIHNRKVLFLLDSLPDERLRKAFKRYRH